MSGAASRAVQALGLRPVVTAAKKAADWAAQRTQPIRDGVHSTGGLPTIAWVLRLDGRQPRNVWAAHPGHAAGSGARDQ